MFESVVSKPASNRRRYFVVVSGVLHGAAIAALIVASMWKIDRVSIAREHSGVALAPPIPAGDSGGGRPKKKEVPKATVIKKVAVRETVQPVHRIETHEETTTTTDEDDRDSAPGTGGGGDGKGKGVPTLGGGCVGLDCPGTAVALAPPPAPKPCSDPSRAHDADCQPPVQNLDVDVIEGLRLSGETQIQPPDDVKIRMSRNGEHALHASFRVCLDTDGNVVSTSQRRSTGYDAYDQALTDAMSTWHYRPYTAGGKPIAVCGAVIFNFTLR